MSERRYGVLIASSQYKDSKLENLRCPENDVDGLNAVLRSKDFGDFAETYVLKNKSHDEVLTKIYQVLREAGKDDLILIYYSGHGKLNAAGKLHLATVDTKIDLLDPTSIPLETIRNYIDISPSNKFVLIIDSCFSGAAGKIFARGSVDDQLQLASSGRGTYVMAASTGIQIANEKEGDQYGLFTKHIIDGIKTGKAANEDGLVTMDTLYKHVHEEVLKESSQEPMKWDINVRGELVIARSGTRREERAKLIKQILVDKVNVIPDYIFTQALEIIRKKANQLSEEERRYDNLLDKLYQKRLELNEFIHEWYMIERDRMSKEEKVEEPIARQEPKKTSNYAEIEPNRKLDEKPIARPEPKEKINYIKSEQYKTETKDFPLNLKQEQLKHDVRPFGKPAESGRWSILIAGIIIQLCLGAIYAYGAVRGDISGYFKTLMAVSDPATKGPNALDMVWPFIIFLLIFALTMPLVGPYIPKMGPKKVGMIGGALCGLGWLAASFANSPTMLIPLYAVIGGLGVGIAYNVPIQCSAQWFPDKRGLAVGLTVLGFGFSSALISYVTLFLKGIGYTIMPILRIYGIIFIIVTVVASMYLRFPPAGWKPAGWAPPTPVAGAAQRVDFMRNEMTKTGTFKGLWLCYTIGALAGLMAIGIVGPVAREVMTNAGMKAADMVTLTFQLILPFAAFNGFARPVFGTLTDKLTPRNAAMITFVGIIVACLLQYTMYSSVMAFIVTFCLLWGCFGAWLAIAPTATASYFGMKDNAKNYGLMFTAYGVGAVVGGIVSAEIAATTVAAKGATFLDAYRPFFLVVAVLAALGLVVAFTLLKPPVKSAA